jgi:hypothetical protein
MARIGRSIDVPLLTNMAEGSRTPVSCAEAGAGELDFHIANYAVAGLLAAAAAFAGIYYRISETCDTAGDMFFRSPSSTCK